MTLLGDWRLLAFLVRCGWLDKSSRQYRSPGYTARHQGASVPGCEPHSSPQTALTRAQDLVISWAMVKGPPRAGRVDGAGR
jgi:hypothetical protein